MRKIFCIAIILISFSLIYSQTREMVLIIDTTLGKYDFIPTFKQGGFAGFPNEIRIKNFDLEKFPNFISEKFLINDSTTIYIPLSSKGDFLEIRRLEKIKDTLRIDKIAMIKNNLPDTTYTVKNFYKEINDSLVFWGGRTEKSFPISKMNKSKKIKHELIIVINGKKYYSTFVITKGQNIITSGSGTIPKNPYKKNGRRKKNVIKFNFISETVHWIYKATIFL
jgi:hypothetical protein